QIGIPVYLTVRMGQRDPDLLAAVLEAEHLLDAGGRDQVGGPMPPRVDDKPRMRLFQIGEGPGVVAGKADHLTATMTGRRHKASTAIAIGKQRRLTSAGQAREPVFEDDNVVIQCGYLAGQPAGTRT